MKWVSKTCALPPLVVAVILLSSCGGSEDEADSASATQSPAQSVQVMEMARRDIELDKSYSGKLRSEEEATVVARVQGVLEERHFAPGDRVEKGESLYTIEPDIYQATLDQRKADLQSARAKLNQASRDVKRVNRLRRNKAISEREYDQTLAQKQIAAAAVAQARAAVDNAQINLDYTDVVAPVSGRIGLSQVNAGNVVDSGTELATITPLNPLKVRFQMPQAEAFDLRRQRQDKQSPIRAVLEFPDLNGEQATAVGRLDFLGSSVDTETSTVQAQAVFDNPQKVYLPGQFVRVHVKGLTRYNVLAVPEIAVTQGLMGPQVFTVGEDKTVTATNVTVGETAGPRLIISDGLEPGMRVIVSDPGGIEVGATIEPQPYDNES